MTRQLAVGLGSTRCVGKDTLAALLTQLDYRFVPYSFATPLKADLAPYIWTHFQVDVWNCTPEDKEVIRPLLIGYGMAQRARDPDYWVKRTIAAIRKDLAAPIDIVPVVTDCRFSNEVRLMRETFPGFRFVNVTRDGAPPPSDEEEKHYRQVAAMADYDFRWGNDTPDTRLGHARRLLGWLNARPLVIQ